MQALHELEWQLFTLLTQISECKRTIKAAEEAKQNLNRLRQQLAEVAREYLEATSQDN